MVYSSGIVDFGHRIIMLTVLWILTLSVISTRRAFANSISYDGDGTSVQSKNHTAQFGASVFLGGFWDLDPEIDGPGAPSRCEQALENINQIQGIRKVQFTPTFFWDDVGPLDPPVGFDSSCAGQSTTHFQALYWYMIQVIVYGLSHEI